MRGQGEVVEICRILAMFRDFDLFLLVCLVTMLHRLLDLVLCKVHLYPFPFLNSTFMLMQR